MARASVHSVAAHTGSTTRSSSVTVRAAGGPPAFTHFEKRFCRSHEQDPSHPTALAGCNFQPLAPLTGPGYFVARDDPAGGEVLIDYRELPASHPPDWPEIRSNERGLARLVYGFMLDRLRRVSQQVSIGCATRRGREIGSWFVLARESG